VHDGRAADESPEPARGQQQAGHSRSTLPFLLYLAGSVALVFGDSLFEMAVVWHILQATGSATIVGGVAAVIQLPVLLTGPFAGVLADRWRRKRLIIWSRATRGLVIAVVFVLYWLEALSPWHLLAVGVADSFIQVLGGAAGSAVVPNLVGEGRVHKANAWLQGGSQVAPMVAGAVGGLVIAAVGIAGIAGITSALFLVSGFLLTVLSDRSFGGGHTTGEHLTPRVFASEFSDGIRWIIRSPALQMLMLTALLANLVVAGPIFVLMPIYAADVLGAGAATYGFLRGSMVAGTLVGLLAAGYLGGRVRVGVLLVCSVASIGLQFVVLAFTASFWLSCILWAVVGLALSLINIPAISAVQLAVPDETRGRVMTAFMALAGGSTPASLAAIGPIAENLGVARTYLVAGSALLLLGGVTWSQRRRFSAIDR